MLSLQALHYQSMGPDLNLESSNHREEEQTAGDIHSASEDAMEDPTATNMTSKSGTPSSTFQDSGKQEFSGQSETLQGVLSIIESAVYPHCGHDTSSVSSRSIGSEQGNSEQKKNSVGSEDQGQRCRSAVLDASEGAAQVLSRSGSTTGVMSNDAIDTISDHTPKAAEIFAAGEDAEEKSMIIVDICDDVQLAPSGLSLQHSEGQLIERQDPGVLETQPTAQAAEHSVPPSCQSPGPPITAFTHISGSQAKGQVDGKQEHTGVSDGGNVESQVVAAQSPQDIKQSDSTTKTEIGIQGSFLANNVLAACLMCDHPSASPSLTNPLSEHASQSRTGTEETVPTQSLIISAAPIDHKQIVSAQETSKSLSHVGMEAGDLQTESTLVQRPDNGMASLQSQPGISDTTIFINLEPEATHASLLSDKPGEVSKVTDRKPHRMPANLLKRSFTNIDASEASRKKPRMYDPDQKSLDEIFQWSKGRGSPRSTSRPLPTLTSPSSALDKAQSQTGSKRRKHVNDAVSSRKSQPLDVQDGHRRSRKTFSMPVPEYTLFYASPVAKLIGKTGLGTADGTAVKDTSCAPIESSRDKLPVTLPERATGDVGNNIVPPVSGTTSGPSNAGISTDIPPKASGGLSGGRPTSPDEKDWKQSAAVSQQSQTHSLTDQGSSPQSLHAQDDNVGIAKKPLVVFTKFRRPPKNIIQIPKTAALMEAETSSITSSIGTHTLRKPSMEPHPTSRQARALEKLKRPFRSPLKSDEKPGPTIIPRASPTVDETDSSHSGMTACTFPSDMQLVPTHRDNTSQNQTGPDHLHSERIITKRLASSFASPFSSPLKGSEVLSPASALSDISHSKNKSFNKPHGGPNEDRTGSGISLPGEVAALERRKQILKQAIKIKRDPQEEHLQELVTQWKQAGRDIVELLYQIVPRPEQESHSHSISLSTWDPEPSGTSSNESQDIQSVRDGQRDVEMAAEIQESRDWNYGTMMLSLQVDPLLLGWNEATGDWEM
ncbi:hypothetical protein QFC22_000984 [Naganishia vaughanmartiniae]|uniref:Uncharacterized protein n=1 Tax=Naganishia vaughanmartiniae TaxID=1424756 RepID=A0ACC2XNA8_9TREE|nr:hypothetical protein QFC22_000984 [Naganishia vaughanmartiniae]